MNILNVSNKFTLINKIKEFKENEETLKKLKQYFKENYNKNMNINNNNKYEEYCKNIMKKYKIKNYNQFKNYLNEILEKNEKNENFVFGMKKILCEEYSSPMFKAQESINNTNL